jgi:hypothetical protein
LDAEKTDEAVKGSEIVYFTAGLPVDTATWLTEFPILMQNVINVHLSKIIFTNNSYP